jgi:hypothetical protein
MLYKMNLRKAPPQKNPDIILQNFRKRNLEEVSNLVSLANYKNGKKTQRIGILDN